MPGSTTAPTESSHEKLIPIVKPKNLFVPAKIGEMHLKPGQLPPILPGGGRKVLPPVTGINMP